MAERSELQDLLKTVSGIDAVYFQPPPNVQMVYPCIVYKRDNVRFRHADGLPYKRDKRYLVTVIVRDPDSALPDLIAALPLCIYDRFYATEDLNHDVFKLFF